MQKIDQFLTGCNSRSTGCDDDVSPKLILLSGIDASAMTRNRARAFSLPNMIGCKQSATITARYYKNILCKHCIYVYLKKTVSIIPFWENKRDGLTTTSNKKDHEAWKYKTRNLWKVLRRQDSLSIWNLKRVTEIRNITLIILHSIFYDWDKIQRNKYGSTYNINTPVEIDHRISSRTIVLILLTRNYISRLSTLHNDHRKNIYCRVPMNPELLLYRM